MNRFTAKLFVALALCLSLCAQASQSALSWGIHVDGTTLQNNIFAANAAISTMQSGTSDPGSNGGAYSLWADTGSGLWKMRNSSNTAWIAIGPLLTPYAYLVSGTVPTSLLPTTSTSAAGIVQLENSTASTSTTKAPTSNAVKTAYDTAVSASNNAATAISTANNAQVKPSSVAIFNYQLGSNQTSGGVVLYNSAYFSQVSGSNYNPATGIFTAPSSGYYVFNAAASFANATLGDYAAQLTIYANGNPVSGGYQVIRTSTSGSVTATAATYLTAGQTAYVVVIVGGGSLTSSAYVNGGAASYFSGYLLSQ